MRILSKVGRTHFIRHGRLKTRAFGIGSTVIDDDIDIDFEESQVEVQSLSSKHKHYKVCCLKMIILFNALVVY